MFTVVQWKKKLPKQKEPLQNMQVKYLQDKADKVFRG